MKSLDSIFSLYTEGKQHEFSKELYKYMEGTGQGVANPAGDAATNGINAAPMPKKRKCMCAPGQPCKCGKK